MAVGKWKCEILPFKLFFFIIVMVKDSQDASLIIYLRDSVDILLYINMLKI